MDQEMDRLKRLLIENKFYEENDLKELISRNDNQNRSQLELILESLHSRGGEEMQTFANVVRESGLIEDFEETESDGSTDANTLCFSLSKQFKDIMNEIHDRGVQTADIPVKFVTEQIVTPDCYDMNRSPRGYCVIINNKKFAKRAPYRKGSVADEQRLTKVFKKFGFKVKPYHDLSAIAMQQKLLEISRDQDLSEHNALVVIILSHGLHNDVVISHDEEKVSVDSLLEYFNGKNCPKLIDKPKIFFINACRGGFIDTGVKMPTKANMASLGNVAKVPKYSDTHKATWKDFYVCHSTSKNHVSLRNEDLGSYFCYELAYRLADWAHNTEFLKIMTQKVAENVEQIRAVIKVDDTKREVVYQAIEVRVLGSVKDLYFNPGFPVD